MSSCRVPSSSTCAKSGSMSASDSSCHKDVPDAPRVDPPWPRTRPAVSRLPRGRLLNPMFGKGEPNHNRPRPPGGLDHRDLPDRLPGSRYRNVIYLGSFPALPSGRAAQGKTIITPLDLGFYLSTFKSSRFDRTVCRWFT
jgi:hypothetical protein